MRGLQGTTKQVCSIGNFGAGRMPAEEAVKTRGGHMKTPPTDNNPYLTPLPRPNYTTSTIPCLQGSLTGKAETDACPAKVAT